MARKPSPGGNRRGSKGPSIPQQNRQAASRPAAPASGNPIPLGKVGSDPEAARHVGGDGDFGAPVDNPIERNYTSANTKASDPGASHPHAGTDGYRAGVGASDSGLAAGSGGDFDTDFVGVAGGAGTAQNAPGAPPGPDDSDGTSREFASGPPAKGEYGPKAGKIEGTTVDTTGGDFESTAEGRGASAVSTPPRANPDQLDDSFAGEISEGEAAGQDNA